GLVRRGAGADRIACAIRASRQLPPQHLERIPEATIDAERRRRLVTAVDHAVLATRVLAASVAVPVGVLHQVLERRVVLVGDQVARPLPAAYVARRVAPGRTLELALAREELQVDRRRHHAILREELFRLLELGPDLVPRQED